MTSVIVEVSQQADLATLSAAELREAEGPAAWMPVAALGNPDQERIARELSAVLRLWRGLGGASVVTTRRVCSP